MENFDQMNEMYFDVLREIGNIGAGNATTAISNMLNLRLNMEVPQVRLLDFQELSTAIGPEDEVIVGVFLEVTNDISGSMMFLMTMESAYYLVNKLMGRDISYREPFSDMDLSALQEIGNIIAGSYLSALAGLTGLTISPSVPSIAVDMEASILSVPAIQFGQYGDSALLIQTEFGDEMQIEGFFILLPDMDSYSIIMKALGITV
ncbi:MAG: chemotaxis protein CheC [Eubacterium sp.]|jgi:Chemotaxis protein CheC, inhibitor of MCP methylation|nr:chemotaxis protein CheC [Eubacterium sp.]